MSDREELLLALAQAVHRSRTGLALDVEAFRSVVWTFDLYDQYTTDQLDRLLADVSEDDLVGIVGRIVQAHSAPSVAVEELRERYG